MSTLAVASGTFDNVYSKLLTHPAPLLNPSKPTSSKLTDEIASLYLHPALEITLHILNNDLVSAHFLVRHMEAAPAHEAMFLHGILHRIEGDFDNSRAWYRDVSGSDVFKAVWESEGEGLKLLDDIEGFVKRKGSQTEKEQLVSRSRGEFDRVIEFLVKKFGKEKWQDASTEWHYAEGEGKKIKDQMILGQEGFREF